MGYYSIVVWVICVWGYTYHGDTHHCDAGTKNRVFSEVLSRCEKLWSRRRRKKTCAQGATCKLRRHKLLEGSESCISSILEQTLESLNKTQTSLNFRFFIKQHQMNNCFCLSISSCHFSPWAKEWNPLKPSPPGGNFADIHRLKAKGKEIPNQVVCSC